MNGDMQRRTATVRAVLFDFGGVLAEEGFRNGLRALAGRFGLEPENIYRQGAEAVYESEYVLGRGREEDFWNLLRRKTGLPPYEASFTDSILERFILRPRLLEAAAKLRSKGYVTAILSDQTDWLDRLEARDSFFSFFDRIFNSYYLGKGKRDPSVFSDVIAELGIEAGEALFIDDHAGHVERARSRGLQAFVFTDEWACLRELEQRLGCSIGPVTAGG